MFFSFSLFPPGISARCSRSALPPGFPPGIPSGGAWLAERFRAPPAFGGLSVFAGVSALRPFSAFPSGISARRLGLRYRLLFPVCVPARHSLRRCLARGAFPRSACLWGLVRFCRRFCLAALLRVSVRHFRPAFGSALPPVIPGLRSRPAFPPAVLGSRSVSALRLPLGACPLLHGLFSACGYFRIRQKTRLPESGRWLAALRRLPPGPFFRTGRRLRQRRNPRRTGCKVTYNSLIIAAFTIYSQFLQQRLRSP